MRTEALKLRTAIVLSPASDFYYTGRPNGHSTFGGHD
jgi:hypothetical protein